MPSSRSCRSSYDCIVKIKGVTMRPILFSQLMRSDGEGAMNPEELFADDRSPASEQERVHEDELHSLMRSILDWAISFLSESSQGTIRAIYFEGKTVKQHSEEEYVTVYAIYKRQRTERSCGCRCAAARASAGRFCGCPRCALRPIRIDPRARILRRRVQHRGSCVALPGRARERARRHMRRACVTRFGRHRPTLHQP